jgi:hypothetical protein
MVVASDKAWEVEHKLKKVFSNYKAPKSNWLNTL